MRIKRMRATFGKLRGAELTLSDGLNIIYAPNEAGKSTWCGFLRAMFYGIETTQRDKKGFLAEKNRYAPWSGAPMEGEVELEWQGRDITLRRFAAGNSPFGGFSAVYSDTQQPVPNLTGENCGLVLLGVEREVWERSAFVGQGATIAVDGTRELERRIAAMVSTGQEDTSYTESREVLGRWLRRRKHNKSGLIPQLEEELAQVDATLTKLADAHGRFATAQSDIVRLEQEQSLLEGERQIHARLAARDLNQRYAQAVEQRERLRNWWGQMCMVAPDNEELLEMQQRLGRLEVLHEELRRADGAVSQAACDVEQAKKDCPDHPVSKLTRPQLDGVCQVIRQLQQKGTLLCRLRILSVVAGLCLGVATSVLTRPILAGTLGHWLGIPVAVVTAGICFCTLRVVAWNCRQRANSILAKYDVSTVASLIVLWEQGQTARTRLEQAEGHLTRCRQEREQAAARYRAVEDELRELTDEFQLMEGKQASWAEIVDRAAETKREADSLRQELTRVCQLCEDLAAQGAQELDTLEQLHQPQRTPEQTQERLAQVEGELAECRSRLALAQGELLAMGDRARLEARRESLQAQLERRRMEYGAIEAAIAALDQANETLQRRFAPRLNRLAGQLLARLTDGRYEGVTLNRDFEAEARGEDGVLPRPTLALSRGTGEQVYFAIRLAIYRLCLPEEYASPVVLDDALLTFDETRMARAVAMLAEMDRQVLLFSCQRREAELGTGNILTLQSE